MNIPRVNSNTKLMPNHYGSLSKHHSSTNLPHLPYLTSTPDTADESGMDSSVGGGVRSPNITGYYSQSDPAISSQTSDFEGSINSNTENLSQGILLVSFSEVFFNFHLFKNKKKRFKALIRYNLC